MSVEYFLDTNVLVYSFDKRSPEKQKRSLALVSEAIASGNGVISWQVCQEFMSLALHKSSAQVAAEDLASYFEAVLKPLCQVHSRAALYLHALEIHRQTQYRFYDSLIIAAALSSGAKILFSEDLQHGRVIGELTIRNPFL